MKKFLTGVILFNALLFCTINSKAQINLYTEDLPRFYEAFDSVATTIDSVRQMAFIQKLYVDKASEGLLGFMKLRGGNTAEWRKLIVQNKEDLIKKRPWILSVLKQQPVIEQKISRFKKLYPDFRDGDIYFCVGINNSGGTIFDNTVYIGTEVVASAKSDWAVFMVLHEFVHTQQWTQKNIKRLEKDTILIKDYMRTHDQLLGRCLEEGIADFIGELAYGESLAKTNPEGHTAKGLKNEQEVWKSFKNDMFQTFDINKGWLYNKKEINGEKITDLGYFVGYQICKSYYKNAKDKQLAIKEMLSTNFTDENAKKFLLASGYLSKEELSQINNPQ